MEAETDDLSAGIGQPDGNDQAADSLDILLKHPQIAKLIDAAVQQRLAAAGHAMPEQGLSAVVAGIERLISINAAQQPGYMKPLPADEIERRSDAFIEMNALIEGFRRDNTSLQYKLVGEPFFAGEIEYPPESIVAHYYPPNEHMLPITEPARRVHATMMRWIGGPQLGIAERVEIAERERRQGATPYHNQTPFKPPGTAEGSGVQLIEGPPDVRAFDPRRPPQTLHDLAQQRIVHQV